MIICNDDFINGNMIDNLTPVLNDTDSYPYDAYKEWYDIYVFISIRNFEFNY